MLGVIVIKNELNNIFMQYFSKDKNSMHYMGNGDLLLKVRNMFSLLVPYERPDAYAMFGNDVLIMEYFEFDACNNKKRKGSLQRREQDNFDREIRTLIGSGKSGTLFRANSLKISKNNYMNNLTKQFNEHYRKLNDYKNNLIKQMIVPADSNFIKSFFIEDVTIHGSIYIKDNSLEHILPFRCDFFLDLFEKNQNIDCMLWASPNVEDSLWFIERGMIDDYRKEQLCMSDIELWNPEITFTGGSIVF